MGLIEERALQLLESTTKGLNFEVPNVDFNSTAFTIPDSLAEALQQAPQQLTLEQLTDKQIGGAGCFDVVMSAMKAHLTAEYEANRITGAEYTKAYIAMMQSALQFSVQYLLGKDGAYFQALGAQAQALSANIDAYTAKVRLAIAQSQAHQSKAQYAAQVLQLSSVEKQTGLIEAQTDTQVQQKELLVEQTQQAHAQVSDTQLDGKTPVTGYTGRQNNLLTKQAIAFDKDAVIKAAKIYSDSLATQLSMGTATVEGTGLDRGGIAKAMGALQNTMTN